MNTTSNTIFSLDATYVKQFQNNLLEWYRENKRTLPWRKNQDPYRVWVSEIMLQQTRVDTVIPYFERFTTLFPTLHDLAYADEEKVLKAWEGLGYYSRVRNLQTAVREVCESYGGKVPDTPREIASLKGVGPYTAGAILSIAYGVPEPAVDGNVMRVLSRILLIEEDISKPKTRVTFEKAVRELISHEDPSSFNQALMELGALICTPKSPACLLCPMRDLCRGFEEGKQRELPVKLGKTKVRKAKMAAGIIVGEDGSLLLHKRPSEGLLANMWEFPNTEYVGSKKDEEAVALTDYVEENVEADVMLEEKVGYIEHVFSHLKWEIQIWKGKMEVSKKELPPDWKWVSVSELDNYPFAVSHQKIIRLVKEALIL
ncbi:A/G-specific adenine glycosylase [Fictibacillus nanhaiensis]|uniref:A/G-specific adenine glycosylase n=1 Tax=Fictibacillus nanhaiensis TaxID=742169 RepID=UPI001C939330|nr:A/G-specific adenine glycosylase [Fictibacillus nanhaiensis]MBY6038383.1 A/G-specific adenine glycosylase [Fictibacillus nanhaiensis]